MLAPIAAALLSASIFDAPDAPEPDAPTSRWGAAAGTSWRVGVGHGVNNVIGPRFALLAPPSDERLYLTPSVALLFEGEAGTQRGFGATGAEARVEFLVAPAGGLLAPWFVAWVSGGAGVAWLGGPSTPVLHVGVGAGGNAFADGGAWGPYASWADWMEGISWPAVLVATLAGLPAAMLHVELRLTFYPAVSGTRVWPSVLIGMGM